MIQRCTCPSKIHQNKDFHPDTLELIILHRVVLGKFFLVNSQKKRSFLINKYLINKNIYISKQKKNIAHAKKEIMSDGVINEFTCKKAIMGIMGKSKKKRLCSGNC